MREHTGDIKGSVCQLMLHSYKLRMRWVKKLKPILPIFVTMQSIFIDNVLSIGTFSYISYINNEF